MPDSTPEEVSEASEEGQSADDDVRQLIAHALAAKGVERPGVCMLCGANAWRVQPSASRVQQETFIRRQERGRVHSAMCPRTI
jgi:hypothetical protein